MTDNPRGVERPDPTRITRDEGGPWFVGLMTASLMLLWMALVLLIAKVW